MANVTSLTGSHSTPPVAPPPTITQSKPPATSSAVTLKDDSVTLSPQAQAAASKYVEHNTAAS